MQIDFQSHLYQTEECIDLLSNVSFGLSEHNMYKSNELPFKETFFEAVRLSCASTYSHLSHAHIVCFFGMF